MTFAEQCADLRASIQKTQSKFDNLKDFLIKSEEPDFDMDAWFEEQKLKKFYDEQTGAGL